MAVVADLQAALSSGCHRHTQSSLQKGTGTLPHVLGISAGALLTFLQGLFDIFAGPL